MGFGQSFESVMEAAKVGSDWAWAAIYREISGPLTGFFRSRGSANPEDAAGDVFFEISRNVDRFRGNEEDFRTLVFAIAYRRVVEDRDGATAPRTQLADRILDRIRRDVEVMDAVADTEVSEDLRAAFEVLTPDQRDVISLRVVGGLSVEQTAEVVDIRVGAVKALQRKGLARIRRLVAEPLVMS